MRKVGKFKITCNETVDGVEDVIEDLLDEKEEITKIFVTKRINKPFVPKVIGNLQKKKGRF